MGAGQSLLRGKGSILVAGCCALLCGCGGGGGQSGGSNASPAASASATASATTPAPAAVKDTCSLVTKADAEKALGEPVGSPRPRSSATSNGCAYTSVSGSARLDVAVFHFPDAASAVAEYQRFGNIGQPVPGLGDQARGNTALLAVQKGSGPVTVSMPVADKQPDQFGAMKSLAGKVLGEL